MFILDLWWTFPWDPSEQSWKVVDGLGIVPFFGYSTKINYRRNKTRLQGYFILCV